MIPWIGGKSRLAEVLIPIVESVEHTCYVEPFCGAAGLFFRRRQAARVEVLNDLSGDLVSLYRVVQHHLEEFVRQFKFALASRQMFDWLQMSDPRGLTDIQRAARFFYLQKMAFGGKVTGQTFGTATTEPARLNLLRIEQDLSDVHLRLNGVQIEHSSWADCMRRYDRPHTLFFLDPPYWGTAGYGFEFGIEQYALLAQAMRSIKGKAILTVNDVPAMREAFAGFALRTAQVTYSVARDTPKRRPVLELIYTNWPA